MKLSILATALVGLCVISGNVSAGDRAAKFWDNQGDRIDNRLDK